MASPLFIRNTRFNNDWFKSLLNSNCYKYLCINSVKRSEIMPKDNSALLNSLRQHRLNNSKKLAKNALTTNLAQLCVLGNGSKGNPRALYVLTDKYNYLFNCGEGTQRLANEYKLKLSKLENIFLTKHSIENMTGMVGLALTCQDMGVPSLTFHGPQNLDQFISLYNYFFKFYGMTVQTRDYIDYNFEDSDLSVKCYPIFQTILNQEKQTNKKLITELNSEKEMSFLYVCKLKARAGELLIEKCKELNVPPGPLLGKLKSGEDVVLSDGRVIRSKDVLRPEEKGPVFIVLECPSIRSIDSLITNESIFEDLSEDLNLVSVVVHFTPTEVIKDQRYQKWMKRFNDSVNHFAINEENPKQSFVSANILQIKLNLIDSYIFPLLNCIETEETNETLELNVIKTNTLSKYHLRPSNIKGLDFNDIINIDVERFKSEALSNIPFMESLSELQSIQSKLDVKTQDFPELIFLGTGSAVPSKQRNTSAIWVNIDSETSFLMDCGEGTFGQLYRFYGKVCDQYIKQLKAIYVSHLHADHHMGMIQMIKKRSLLTTEPIILIIPPAVYNWLQDYNENIEKISHLYTSVLCEKFIKESDDNIINSLRLKEIKTTLVPHCSHSYGITFTTKTEPNFKIVYSGDTQPAINLTRIGQNCDLLIHEASMEDDLVAEARLKFHSTTSEAIQSGSNMNAKFTILTHFSQRYSKIPLFNDNFNDRVGIAFDNMRVRISDLDKLSKMIPTLKCLFDDKIKDLEARTVHYNRRKEILSNYELEKSNST